VGGAGMMVRKEKPKLRNKITPVETIPGGRGGG
jgi:hypothetical protein